MRVQPLRPTLASSAVQLPTGAGWSFEVKFDGYRTLALKDGVRVKLLSRNLKDATKLYPSVARKVARLLEQIADAGCPDAYEHLKEITSR